MIYVRLHSGDRPFSVRRFRGPIHGAGTTISCMNGKSVQYGLPCISPAWSQVCAYRYSWAVRWEMLLGEHPWLNDLDDYDSTPLQGPAERGCYLASIACTECHAPDLGGYEGDIAPGLVPIEAYPDENFARLMHDGITLSGLESASGMMTETARTRFVRLRPDDLRR